MISILTTIGTISEDGRDPVLNAVRQNLENSQVSAVHVVTESDVLWLAEAFAEHADRLHFETVKSRPSFAMLIETGNRLLREGAACIGLMNADVSLPYSQDIGRINFAFKALGEYPAPVVFAVSRHEQVNGKLQIELYDGSGMPNYVSADAWIFRKPLRFQRELFYCPGQMNCDMLLAHDLIAAGYRLFNPALDVRIVHHEEAKDDAFYSMANEQDGNKEIVWRHAAQNGLDPWNCYGIPLVESQWLVDGYRPAPLDTLVRSFIVAVEDPAELTAESLAMLDGLCRRFLGQCQLIYAGDLQNLYDQVGTALAQYDRIVLSPVQKPVLEVREAFMRGLQYTSENVVFISDMSHATDQILRTATCIFVGSPRAVAPEQDKFGCTFVTSVFRSDAFLKGFLSNSACLTGYDKLIDHIFLIEKVSDLEAQLLNEAMQRHPNIMVFWNRKDPGLYSCWNIGIQLARRPYISNANVDDLRDPDHVITLIKDLEQHPEVLVAATALNPFHEFPPDGTLPSNREGWYSDRAGRFTALDLGVLSEGEQPRLDPHNMPHCMPVWRRSLHDRYGWFDEQRYGTYADWAFWLRVLSDGAYGWINPAPLGFYFVNLESHNRRGTNLDLLHKQVEDDFMGMFLAKRDGRPIHASRPWPNFERKLQLRGRGQTFGKHRNDFGRLIRALEPAEREDGGGVLFLPFLERYFVWGDGPGEAASADPQPITQDWIGILHVPFDAPSWFDPRTSPESFFATSLWKASRPYCRGIITLAKDLEEDLKAFDPALRTLSVLHPVDMEDVRMFDPAAYRAAPKIVQVGDWLRKLQAIHRLEAPGHQRIMLLKAFTENYLQHEIWTFGDNRDPDVDMRRMVPNEEYDALLSSSVVLCQLYSTAANNVVIECIARATPILINPLPAVVEYLGPDYPLYASDNDEAALKLLSPGQVEAAHQYLLKRRQEVNLSYEGFARSIVGSEWYMTL